MDEWNKWVASAHHTLLRFNSDIPSETLDQMRSLLLGISVPMPRNADHAVAMLLLSESWLRNNAPDRLRAVAISEPSK